MNEKEKMNKEASEYRKKVWYAIAITFVAFAALLVVFCATLVISLIVGGFKGEEDVEAPEIIGPADGSVVGYVGESPVYKQMVRVVDDKDEAPILRVNNSKVNINKEGEYPVYFRAEDASGNISGMYTLTYIVKSKQYSEDTLMSMVAELAEELDITEDMSKKAKVRAIYSFVNQEIKWSGGIGESNIPDIDRKKWKTDWVEEAVRTIELYNEGDCKGDCYSYYSVSKAFFEYFDIRNEGIQRSASSEEEGTHFWNVVEIEEGWYYYDATRLAGKFADGSRNACLITQAKLDSYVTSSGGTEFYKMTKLSGITISKKELD